jgi:hypothetical protein
MNLYKKTYEDIREKKLRAQSGGINAIPFAMPALTKYVPGIMEKTQYGLTAESGASKSKFVRYNFIQTPYDFYLDNKDNKDIDIEIFLFCLEDSADTVMKNFMVSALSKQFNVRLSTLSLNSYFQDNVLSDDLLRKLESLEPYFEEFLKKVHIIDDIRNPFGIYKRVKDELIKPNNGYFVDQHSNKIDLEHLNANKDDYKGVKLEYKTAKTNKFTIVALDNLQNIETEKSDNNSKWHACDNLCRKYFRNMLCNVYKTCNVIVQQQDKSSSKAQYTNSGTAVMEKFLPSLSGLSEYKNSVDSAHCFFGLFNPYKHRITDFEAGPKNYYDITALGDYYRNLLILKSNFAETVNTSLFFDSFKESFAELPHGNDLEKMTKVYDYIQKIRSQIR